MRSVGILVVLCVSACSQSVERTPVHMDTYGLDRRAAPYSLEFMQAAQMMTGVGAKRDTTNGALYLTHLCLMGDTNACDFHWLKGHPRIYPQRTDVVAKAVEVPAEKIRTMCRTDEPRKVSVELAFDNDGRVFVARADGDDAAVACVRNVVYGMRFNTLHDPLAFGTARFEVTTGATNPALATR
jgi:hypothetical protein